MRFIAIVSLLAATLFGYSVVTDDNFTRWKAEFRQTAQAHGVRPEILHTAFTGLLPNQKVLRLDAHQPEFTRAIWDYLDHAVSAERVETGKLRLTEYEDLLDRIVAKYLSLIHI